MALNFQLSRCMASSKRSPLCQLGYAKAFLISSSNPLPGYP